MINDARLYLADRTIARKEPLYSANRFARFCGDIAAEDVTTTHLDSLRSQLQTAGLSAKTIESTIADIVTVVTWKTGSAIKKGRALDIPHPAPKPVPISSINLIWPHCSPQLQAWIAFSYWTALRLSDGMRWLLDHKHNVPGLIEIKASKTQKRHQFPLPEWLRLILLNGPYRWRTVSDYARRAIRLEIAAACTAAKIDTIQPKQFRSRGVTEWYQAREGAGKIVHGVSLGIMASYLGQLEILEAAAPRVRLPSCFGCVGETEETTLISNFRRMDPAAQSIITATAERLSAG